VTAFQVTVTSRSLDDTQVSETPVGPACARASPVLAVLAATVQLEAEAGTAESTVAITKTVADSGASGRGANVRGPRSRRCLLADQLVQLSVTGLVVTVAAPPVAVTPVSDGMEK